MQDIYRYLVEVLHFSSQAMIDQKKRNWREKQKQIALSREVKSPLSLSSTTFGYSYLAVCIFPRKVSLFKSSFKLIYAVEKHERSAMQHFHPQQDLANEFLLASVGRNCISLRKN